MTELETKISLIQKVAMSLPTSTINPVSNFVTKSARSIDKTFGLGNKALNPKGLKSTPAVKNVSNAFTTTKGMDATTSGLGKAASYNGENMRSNILETAYKAGAQAAFEKVAMPMPPQMPMDQMQQQMPMDPAAMQQQQMQAPVAAPMQDIQQDMAAQSQATPEELQQVQNSGLTSGDIASAAKVIQTMAEMKANADMQGMQAVDPAAAGGPAMPAQPQM